MPHNQIQTFNPACGDAALANKADTYERLVAVKEDAREREALAQREAGEQTRYERLRVIHTVQEREAELQRQQLKWIVIAAAIGFLIGWADRQRAEEREFRHERVRGTGPGRRADGGQGDIDKSSASGGEPK